MAIAFYIPDQATLLRKAQQQEQQLLQQRDSHWHYIAHWVLDALRHYVTDATNNTYLFGAHHHHQQQQQQQRCKKSTAPAAHRHFYK